MQLDVEEVRWLLTHIYDNAALAGSAVALQLLGLEGSDATSRAESIRSVLLDCIEFLRPARHHESLKSLAARSYAVLHLRYVENKSISQVAEELALGERQVHRELRLAEAKLAELLDERLAKLARGAPIGGEPSHLGEEVVVVQPVRVDLGQTLAAALQMVQPLARALGVSLTADLTEAQGQLFTDEGILRQLLIQMLSLAVQQTADRCVKTVAMRAGDVVNLTISFIRGLWPIEAMLLSPLEQLATTLGLVWQAVESGNAISLSVALPLKQPRTVLVIEDSGSATELYRRYLEPGGDWRVVAVPEPRLAYDMARSLQPAIIILDILMPSTDGWTILNLLHAHEDTADIPVLVCSVFQDVMLAQSLGAKAHLRKPVSQLQLLSAIKTWAR